MLKKATYAKCLLHQQDDIVVQQWDYHLKGTFASNEVKLEIKQWIKDACADKHKYQTLKDLAEWVYEVGTCLLNLKHNKPYMDMRNYLSRSYYEADIPTIDWLMNWMDNFLTPTTEWFRNWVECGSSGSINAWLKNWIYNRHHPNMEELNKLMKGMSFKEKVEVMRDMGITIIANKND